MESEGMQEEALAYTLITIKNDVLALILSIQMK